MITSPVSLFIVDDDKDDVFIIREIIHELNPRYSLIAFADDVYLKEYIIANNELPAIIFLDLGMRFINGLSILKWLKENSFTKSIPVVIYSCRLSPTDIEEAYLAGAAFYMKKFTNMADQKRLIDYLLKLFSSDEPAKIPKEQFILNQSLVLNAN